MRVECGRVDQLVAQVRPGFTLVYRLENGGTVRSHPGPIASDGSVVASANIVEVAGRIQGTIRCAGNVAVVVCVLRLDILAEQWLRRRPSARCTLSMKHRLRRMFTAPTNQGIKA